MGNFQTGITNEGTLETLRCRDCNVSFKGKVGVVTIKGPSPPPERCDKCAITHKEIMYDSIKQSLTRVTTKQDNTDTTHNEGVLDTGNNNSDHNSENVSSGNIRDVVLKHNGTGCDDESFGIIELHYADWCFHSKAMLPEWKLFEDYAATHFKLLTVRKINYGKDSDIRPPDIVKAYPTILLYVGTSENATCNVTPDSRIRESGFVNSNPITFDYSRRTIEYFVKFVKENGYTSVLKDI